MRVLDTKTLIRYEVQDGLFGDMVRLEPVAPSKTAVRTDVDKKTFSKWLESGRFVKI